MYYEDKHLCGSCDEYAYKLDEVKYWLKDVLEHLYDAEFFNAEELERSLEEVAAIVNMKIPQAPLAIQRKSPDKVVPISKDPLFNYLNELNKLHFETLRKQS